jgi:signal transduction histidine kinase
MIRMVKSRAAIWLSVSASDAIAKIPDDPTYGGHLARKVSCETYRYYGSEKMTSDSYSAEDLRALTEASVTLTSELSLDAILQKLVDVATAQVGSRYGALSVLDLQGRVQRFLTVGISDKERARIPHIPEGKGLLGVILHEGSTLRLDDMGQDPRSGGFPPGHPPMTTLLGVPVVAREQIVGNLYLTDKLDGTSFTERDEQMVKFLATQAAVAVENAALHEESRRRAESLARLEERDRIAMDLHDGVIQTVYGVALHLEDASERLPDSAEAVKNDLERAMSDLDLVIGDIRSYIFDLRPKVSRVSDLPEAIKQLVDNVGLNTLIKVELHLSEPFPELGSESEALALFHITQEALNNVMKHSRADLVRVSLVSESGAVTLEIEDNGVGFEGSGDLAEGQGFRNMNDRADSVGARFSYTSTPGRGTHIRVEMRTRGQ